MAWKDSGDSVVYPDGSLVKGPKALCELQGYVYDAWLRMAEIFDALGKPDRARELRAKAANAVQAVQRGFLGRGVGLLCLCLGRRQEEGADDRFECGTLPVVRHRAAGARGQGREAFNGARHVERLGHSHALRPESGVQSLQLPNRIGLAARQRHHRVGFKRYGFGVEVARIARDISDAASHFLPINCRNSTRRSNATTEAFRCNISGRTCRRRGRRVRSSRLLQAILGFVPDAPRGKLHVDPLLPEWLPDLTVLDLRVGGHCFDIRFWREGSQDAVRGLAGRSERDRSAAVSAQTSAR